MITNDHKRILPYQPSDERYSKDIYHNCGRSGLKLPALSLGLWHNFGDSADLHKSRQTLRKAFDCGITHFDLANNYGPPYGSAEVNFGKMFKNDFQPYRDELIISSKAGFDMWDGPYGSGGSKKYIIASCEQSLKRTGLEYFDIFYHHCPDPNTPVEETAEALAQLVRQGKALYAGISNRYDAASADEAAGLLKLHGIQLLVNQIRFSMFDRRAEALADSPDRNGYGLMPFSPLEQGILAGRYLEGIPEGSRLADESSYLDENSDTAVKIRKAKELNKIAQERGQSLAQLSVSWLLNKAQVASVLIGASSPEQITENISAAQFSPFTEDELKKIDRICVE